MEQPRFRRLAENERLIREANEEAELVALDGIERRAHLEKTEVEFHCACGRADCRATLIMSPANYASVHDHPHRFVIYPGHETLEVERVVERHGSYDVVEKLPRYQAPEDASPPHA